MAFGPLLLRVLLSVTLILNGSGFAMAESPGHGGHGVDAVQGRESTVTDAERVANATPPCHQLREAAQSHPVTSLVDVTHGDTSNNIDEDPSDCCKNGACRCGCVHQTQVATPAFFLRTPTIAPPHLVPELQSGHAEPALPHLMRPPIV